MATHFAWVSWDDTTPLVVVGYFDLDVAGPKREWFTCCMLETFRLRCRTHPSQPTTQWRTYINFTLSKNVSAVESMPISLYVIAATQPLWPSSLSDNEWWNSAYYKFSYHVCSSAGPLIFLVTRLTVGMHCRATLQNNLNSFAFRDNNNCSKIIMQVKCCHACTCRAHTVGAYTFNKQNVNNVHRQTFVLKHQILEFSALLTESLTECPF